MSKRQANYYAIIHNGRDSSTTHSNNRRNKVVNLVVLAWLYLQVVAFTHPDSEGLPGVELMQQGPSQPWQAA